MICTQISLTKEEYKQARNEAVALLGACRFNSFKLLFRVRVLRFVIHFNHKWQIPIKTFQAVCALLIKCDERAYIEELKAQCRLPNSDFSQQPADISLPPPAFSSLT